MANQLIDVSAISNVADPQTDVPGFAIMLSNPATPDDAYYNSESLGIFSQQHAKLSVGFSDMFDAAFCAQTTAWYGFLGTRQDGGQAHAQGTYIVGTAGFFSGGGGLGYGTYGPICGAPGDGPFAEYDTSGFPIEPDGTGVLLISGNRVKAKVITFDLNATTGDQSITGVGFQPDMVIFLGCIDSSGTTVEGTNWMMGAADSNLNQWTGTTRSEFFSANPCQRWSVWYDDNCISHIGSPSSASALTTFDQLASYVSSDTDGFTINLSAAGYDSNGTPMQVRALAVQALGAGHMEVGNATQGDTRINTAAQSDMMLFCSTQQVTPGTVSAVDCYAAVGATERNSGEQRHYWEGTITDTVPDNWAYTSTVSAIRWADYNQSLLAEADVAMDSSGADLTWTTDDAAGRQFGWISIFAQDTNHEPIPVTGPALGITPTQATLTATITPNSEDGIMVTYYFEWGITIAYGNTTPGGAVGDGFLPIGVSEVVIIPVPIGTHYRVVAVDQFGCLYPGEDMVIEQLASWRSIRYQ